MKRKNKCANKKAYSTKGAAESAIEKSYSNYNVRLRYYECPTCLDFHLTKANVDPNYFKKWDRVTVKKQWAQFENLFNRMWGEIYGLSKSAKHNKKKRAKLRLAKQQKADQEHSRLVISRKQKQLPLAEIKLAHKHLKVTNELAQI